MDAASLTLLVEIIDTGSLSKAARKLKMTRANVSYHLGQLERSAGTQLVRRTTRRIEPTEIGVRLYQHGLSIQNELVAAREAVSTLSQTLRGRVRLSVPSGYGFMVMTPWLIEFKRHFPGIALQVLFENRVDDLLRDEVDIAVRVMPEPPTSLVARELSSVRYIVCASRSYAQTHGMPQTIDDLREVPLLASAIMGRQLRVRARLAEHAIELTLEPTLSSEHFPFLRESILAGLGIGLVPYYVVGDAIANGTVVMALDAWELDIFGTRMFMLYMPDRHQTRAARTLIEFIIERAQLSRDQEAARTLPAAGV